MKVINTPACPQFVKLTAENEDKLVEITLNTKSIDSYIAHSEVGSEAKCRINASSIDKDGHNIILVLETKEHLDSLLADLGHSPSMKTLGINKMNAENEMKELNIAAAAARKAAVTVVDIVTAVDGAYTTAVEAIGTATHASVDSDYEATTACSLRAFNLALDTAVSASADYAYAAVDIINNAVGSAYSPDTQAAIDSLSDAAATAAHADKD